MEKIISVKTLSDWDKAATELLNYCKNKKVFAFYGEMGTGKTTFIQRICKALGAKAKVVSPTFALVNEYHGENLPAPQHPVRILHFDLYRLRNIEELLAIGVTEYLDSGDYCFIEWAELAERILPEQTVKVFIELLKENEREIKILT